MFTQTAAPLLAALGAAAGVTNYWRRDAIPLLQYRDFPTWEAYYAWRDTHSERQNIHPCVPSLHKRFYKCLPSLIIIGAFKGGTTGMRHKLLASKQFIGPSGEHHWFAEREKSVTVARAEEAAKYAMNVTRAEFLRGEFVVFEDNPRYVDELNTNELRFIRKVNPDALMLLLARPGADIWFSGLEMNADGHRDCAPFRPYGDDCAAGTRNAAAHAHEIFDEGKSRAIAMERDWESRDVISLSERAGYYVAKGGFVYALRHLWHTWPRAQTLVLESTAVWARPRESYDALAHALGLNFSIRLVEGARTRPSVQDNPKCPKAKVEAMKRLISKCDLKMPYRCAWYSANVLLADLLNVSWPIAWNEGVNVSTCEPYNFTAPDLQARFFEGSSQATIAGTSGGISSSQKYRRADVTFAVDVHRRTAPTTALGSWIRADPARDWLTTGQLSDHMACLNRELQGNCYENDVKGSSRYNFAHRPGSDLRNSPGALAGRIDYAWRGNTGIAATEHLYREWSGPRAELVRGLERVLGVDGRVIIMGDSLSRQFAKTLDCMFQYKLNMSHRVVYRSWFLGGRVVYGTFHAPRPLDVLVLNFGHHLDHGAGDQTHTKLMSQWALTFKDLARNKVAADRVFVRTTQVRFVHRTSPGEWNTTGGMICGGPAPNVATSADSHCGDVSRSRLLCVRAFVTRTAGIGRLVFFWWLETFPPRTESGPSRAHRRAPQRLDWSPPLFESCLCRPLRTSSSMSPQ